MATKFSWPDLWPFHDFTLRFELPVGLEPIILPLTDRANRTLQVSLRTGGRQDQISGSVHIIELTAGLRARLAGGYFGTNAAAWGDEIMIEYDKGP